MCSHTSRSIETRSSYCAPCRNSIIIDYTVVDESVANNRGVNIRHRSVVAERVSCPFTPPVTVPPVTETVVNPTIITDVRSPVTYVPGVYSVTPAPPTGRPVPSDPWWRNPLAGYPVVFTRIIVPRPVPWLPHPAVNWASRLIVIHQCRWSYGN
jgi:hypothetical protein